jgi:hypothetical protein
VDPLIECASYPFPPPHTSQAVPGLFAALARKRLDRDKLLDKTRLVLAEKEIEATQAQLEVTKARADARVANAELETTKFRLQAKNMEALRVANSVHLRGAIGTFVEGIVRVTHVHVSIEQSLSPSPSAFTEAFCLSKRISGRAWRNRPLGGTRRRRLRSAMCTPHCQAVSIPLRRVTLA